MYLPGGSKSASIVAANSSGEGGKKGLRKNEEEEEKESSVGPLGAQSGGMVQGGSDVGIMECHNCGTRMFRSSFLGEAGRGN